MEHKEKHKVVHVERSYGAYSRQFDVSGIDTAGIKARYDKGVLELTLPKQAQIVHAAQRIDIE